MRVILKTGFYFVFTFLVVGADAFGQSSAGRLVACDTTEWVGILFPFGKSEIDANFMGNAQGLEALRGILSDSAFQSGLDSIIVTGAASPDGDPRHNKLLALRRAHSIKDFIVTNYPHIHCAKISTRIEHGYWDGLIASVEQDPHVPVRGEFLEMLRDPELSDHDKAREMNAMRSGVVFVYIRDNYILRRLRRGAALMTYHRQVAESQPEPEPELEPPPPPPPQRQPEPIPESTPEILNPVSQCKFPFALRTNLLLDAIGSPNLGIEIPVGNHFSAAGDFVYAYTRINNRYVLQTVQGSLEARYWFKRRENILSGWNIGLYGTYCSRFDVRWGGGFQGDGYWSGGLSGGYCVPVSDRFNLDFSIAGGFLHSPQVREYSKARDGHLIWEKTRYNVSRIALTQVRVDLVWLINKKVKQ